MNQILKKLKSLVQEDDKVLVAVSGGPDSMALLDLLIKVKKEIPFELEIALVNYHLRENSITEEETVRRFAYDHNIPIHIKDVDNTIFETSKKTTEELARSIRYDFFKSLIEEEGFNKLFTAHHKNDQAETILLNLIRGSGLAGLTGIQEVSTFGSAQLIRPLLGQDKVDMTNYCIKESIPYHIDESNHSLDYSRNRIRHRLIPEIEMINQRAQDNINRTAGLITQANQLLSEILGHYEAIWLKEDTYGISFPEKLFTDSKEFLKKYGLNYLSLDSIRELQARVILSALKKLEVSKDITEKHINSIIELFAQKQSGSIDLPNEIRAIHNSSVCEIIKLVNIPSIFGNYYIGRLSFKTIYFNSEQIKIRIAYRVEKALPDKKSNSVVLDAEKLTGDFIIRKREPGDRLQLEGMDHPKKLNRFLIDKKVPKFLRDSIPILVMNDTIIWIPGLYCHPDFLASPETSEKVLFELKPIGMTNGI